MTKKVVLAKTKVKRLMAIHPMAMSDDEVIQLAKHLKATEGKMLCPRCREYRFRLEFEHAFEYGHLDCKHCVSGLQRVHYGDYLLRAACR